MSDNEHTEAMQVLPGIESGHTVILPGRCCTFQVTGTVVTTGKMGPGGLHICEGASLEITDTGGRTHYLNPASTTLRADPATCGWPPEPGDVWTDQENEEPWFCRRSPDWNVKEMVSATGHTILAHTTQVLAWRLEYRKGGLPS